MLSLPSTVSVNPTAYLQIKKSNHGKHRENYHRDYYLNNREKFLNYSHDYYGVKKLLAPYSKEQKNRQYLDYQHCENNPNRKEYQRTWISQKRAKEKNNLVLNNVDIFFSHTRIKEYKRREKELFFIDPNHPTTPSTLTLTKKQEFTRRLDQKYLRLPTKNKIPQKKGWNWSGFEEWLTKSALLRKYQEWSIRGGKRIGNKYLSFLDLDIFKEDVALTLQAILGKYANSLLKYLRCFHVETKKGYHVYLLTDELLPNQIIYHTDKFGKRRIIGSIQSKGKYVVGFDSKDKKLVEKGQWFWHLKNNQELRDTLGKFFIEVGDKEQIKAEINLLELQQKLRNNQAKTPPLISTIKNTALKQAKSLIQAKILSKQKVIYLNDIWKVFYLNAKTQEKGYFLLNTYQKTYALPHFEIGNMRNMVLIQGIKHQFFNRLQTDRYTIQHGLKY